MRRRNQLIVAAKNFRREQNLFPVQFPIMFRIMNGQLEWTYEILEFLDVVDQKDGMI